LLVEPAVPCRRETPKEEDILFVEYNRPPRLASSLPLFILPSSILRPVLSAIVLFLGTSYHDSSHSERLLRKRRKGHSSDSHRDHCSFAPEQPIGRLSKYSCVRRARERLAGLPIDDDVMKELNAWEDNGDIYSQLVRRSPNTACSCD
jgi:hypothetical protein